MSPLRALAENVLSGLGAAVGAEPLRSDAAYRDTLAREFNLVTIENELKFGPLRPSRDVFAFADADTIIAFARDHAMAVRGHTLLWHDMMPPWLPATCAYDDAIDIVRSHISTVMRRYQGRFIAWDVVNEAFNDNGTWRDTFFLRSLGPDYVTMAFHWAHEADPDVPLFYNDYSADDMNAKSDAIFSLVAGLVKQHAPIHGVGLQMHLVAGVPPKAQSVAANIRRFNELGLDVQITEMDVRIKEPARRRDLERQAAIYREILEVCLAAERCSAFVTWGVSDRYTWVPEAFPGEGSPLLFDARMRPKPAYYAVQYTLAETSPTPPRRSLLDSFRRRF